MHNSTSPSRSGKPSKKPKFKKPHPDFPLTPHPSGRWCKKITVKGQKPKLYYFGKIVLNDGGASAQAALDKWLDEKDDRLAGRVPRAKRSECEPVVDELCGEFMKAKRERITTGDLSAYTLHAYDAICAAIIKAFGKDRYIADITPEDLKDFELTWAKGWGPERRASEFRRVKTLFRFAAKKFKVTVDFGDSLEPPTKKNLLHNRNERGPKMFEADELQRMIDAATQPLRAMFLLAINAGLGNNDIAQLPIEALDLDKRWLKYPRPKTGVMRKCPLWPETIEAVRDWLAIRPTPKTEGVAPLLFLTVRGDGWGTNIKDRPLTHACRKLLDKLKIGGNRNFYGIRHSFETIAGDSRDQVAVDAIMGHDDGSMATKYRDRIGDDRLQAVVEHVRNWLFADAKPDEEEPGPRLRLHVADDAPGAKGGVA